MTQISSPPSSPSPAAGAVVERSQLARDLQERLGLPEGEADQLARSLLGVIAGVIEAPAPRREPQPPRVVTEENARAMADAHLAAVAPYPGFEGRGIVTCAGGERYFPCAWVLIHLLRRLGCTLPIELFYLGPEEMDDHMRELLAPLGVTCIDAFEVRRRHPARILRGWELKPYAILHSRFEEVLFLDADNVPLVNPDFLFETPEFQRTGAVFWPDVEPLGPEHPMWRILGVPYQDEPAFESGQIVLCKRRSWEALQLTMHMNEHSDFYYRHVHGDKETFHLAFRLLDQPYSMIPVAVQRLRGGVFCQHDFTGRRIFQHRLVKWTRRDVRVEGFEREQECLDLLNRLDEVWHGRTTSSAEG